MMTFLIFLFTTEFVPAKLMRDKLMSISAILGFGNAEVFPKQIELKSADDTGNFLNLPYFNPINVRTNYPLNYSLYLYRRPDGHFMARSGRYEQGYHQCALRYARCC